MLGFPITISILLRKDAICQYTIYILNSHSELYERCFSSPFTARSIICPKWAIYFDANLLLIMRAQHIAHISARHSAAGNDGRLFDDDLRRDELAEPLTPLRHGTPHASLVLCRRHIYVDEARATAQSRGRRDADNDVMKMMGHRRMSSTLCAGEFMR